MPATPLMSAQVSPLALIIPRPQIPSVIPRLPTSSFLSFAPRTPSRSPVASHIFISPPAPNRNSTDSWNSSNYDFDDPSVQWKEEEVILLGRTLDALPAHLITPFNGPVPPPNLLDKISRGITAAKGPNDWPHSITATRAKLLDLARARAKQERKRSVIDEDVIILSDNPCHMSLPPESNPPPDRPVDVLQSTINTPNHRRHTLYRQSSMDFMTDAKPDHKESLARLSHRLQRHEHPLHHPYLRPPHLRRSPEHSRSPSTPSPSAIKQSHSHKSSNSISAFGSPFPLCPSSLRRSSTLTMPTSCSMPVDAEGDAENVFKTPDSRRTAGYPEAASGTILGKKHGTKPPAAKTRSANKVKPITNTKNKTKVSVLSVTSPPCTPPSKLPVPPTTVATSIQQPKFRKGRVSSLSVSSDEEEKSRSKHAKKPRTREPSSDVRQPFLASPQMTTPARKFNKRELSEWGCNAASGSKTSSSMSENDNEFSTASIESAATSISLATPAAPIRKLSVRIQKEEAKSKTARRNFARNPSMFGPELPCPQATPAPPSRIPLSSPMYTASPASPSPSTPLTLPLSLPTRPRTLRRAARRISFGSLTNARAASPIQSDEGSTLALGSAFQLA